jgi:hypothetical protein
MINRALTVIQQLSNQYLQNLDRRSDDWVVLTNIVGHDGSANEYSRDKIVMAVYNITKETSISTYTPARPGADSFAIVQPPIYIDVHLMFMANFAGKTYTDGLAAISRLISYFQQNPWFTQSNAPDLGPGIDKITLELESLGAVEVNYIMGMLGTKYLPSVYYKLRMLPFAAPAMQARTFPAKGGIITEAPNESAAWP